MMEMMIAVAIVALIASLAIPGYEMAVRTGEAAQLMSELRTNHQSFQLYFSERGYYPPTPAGEPYRVIPDGMEPYLSKTSTWTTSPKIGGHWFWLNPATPVYGFHNFVGLYLQDVRADQIQRIDQRLDDGNLATGALRLVSGNTLLYGLN